MLPLENVAETLDDAGIRNGSGKDFSHSNLEDVGVGGVVPTVPDGQFPPILDGSSDQRHPEIGNMGKTGEDLEHHVDNHPFTPWDDVPHANLNQPEDTQIEDKDSQMIGDRDMPTRSMDQSAQRHEHRIPEVDRNGNSFLPSAENVQVPI